MSLVKLDPCCECDDHQRPYVNEDGWILTGNPNLPGTWMAWLPDEWKRHCQRYATQLLVPDEKRREIAERTGSAKKIAAEYGITERTVYRYRRMYRRAA